MEQIIVFLVTHFLTALLRYFTLKNGGFVFIITLYFSTHMVCIYRHLCMHYCAVFRRIYNDLASTDSDLKQFQQHANALTQIQLAAAQAQLQQQQPPPTEAAPPATQSMDTQQILQQTVSVCSSSPLLILSFI